MKLRVSELSIYPLKSAKGIRLDTLTLSDKGPHLDRRWMLVDEHGRFLSQRKHPNMCQIVTALKEDVLLIETPGSPQLKVAAYSSDQISAEVWKSEVIGHDCGDEAADYLSAFLNTKCRLIFMHDDFQRRVDQRYAHNDELVGFADGFPLLIATQASLDDFNQKLGFKVKMDRFRPNIVISGNEPYAEDDWHTLLINGIQFTLAKPCSRCIIPSINPLTGCKEPKVNEALLKYRRRDKQTYFGQNALYNKLGNVKTGDEVQILARQEVMIVR